MTVNVTPEVAIAHKNLEELCEKFETSVDEFCASPLQSIRPHEFYEHESVLMATECVEALSEFQSARSYEVTAYENAVADAENELCQQKHRLEENIDRSQKTYENAVTEAENEFHQQKRRFEESAVHRKKIYEDTVAEADEALRELKSELEFNANQRIGDIEADLRQIGVDFTFSQEKVAVTNVSKIPYGLALERFNRVLDQDSNSSFSDRLKNLGCLFLFFIGMCWPIGSCTVQSCKDTFLPLVIVPMIIAIIFSLWKHNKKPKALQILKSAAQAKCDIIWGEMEKLIANASAECDRKVKDAHDRKEREDKQAAEAEAVAIPSAETDKNAKVEETQERKEMEERQSKEMAENVLAAYDKKVEKACLRRDQALTYIEQEHQVFDTRLCQYLDKWQSFVDAWTAKNARVTSILDENWVQKFSENSERIASSCTRVGNLSFWNSIEKSSEVEIEIAHTKTQALSETKVYIRDVLVPVLSKISAKMFSKRTDDTQIPVINPENSAKMSLKEAKEADDAQIPVIKPENSEDFDNYLRDIFNDWCAKGDIEFNLLSAFHSILRIAGYEDPKQTIQSWVMSVKELAANALEMPIAEFGFLDIDLSIELDQLGVEESFFLFYAYSRNEVDQRKNIKYTVATRLALNALVGERQQQQMVEAFNKILESE